MFIITLDMMWPTATWVGVAFNTEPRLLLTVQRTVQNNCTVYCTHRSHISRKCDVAIPPVNTSEPLVLVPLSAETPCYTVLSKVDDFATFKKVEVHAKNSTF